MTLLKEKSDKQWGITTTYQCHNERPFVVVTVTTSVMNKMAPEMFDVATTNWKDVAPNAPTKGTLRPKFKGLKEAPPRPWTRMTNSSALWDAFWETYLKDGSVNKALVLEMAAAVKGHSPNLKELVRTLPDWMTEKSGYVVKLIGDHFEVVGKA
jgi:hypothetical protein